MELFCKALEELPTVAAQIVVFAQEKKIWLFNGEMGAGKTTLIKAICEHLEVIDNVSSPTFSIVNEYLTKKNSTIYHFDFYRIKNEREVREIGIEEYFDSGNYCFLEWASLIPSLIPASYLNIDIELLANNQRVIKLRRHE
ncbi:tRNA (adenosine(37)-N6)-threonylcarbamoyltransferase complex ATPase subunit type 1 TsaE [Thermoflexibacter ruber]|uniref:tRNA threonylcarbamoyladenosine biosynthesis protein TsaE n=1 Tax=Thermoflexibacter ruber TaxID=1003 RepID=A0A1I2GIP5_9BACT|nr:tRNA (adenosine(37)-N6)-threonylcarbamoyltransferase complex ATPase subunit type 1 TsaE [Thermoflexibacter ruber]SFF17098.1 tRNA threonylcarbamoyladenosine biosynthesis protein TsaE [Thermoflexibacter ruber]